VLKQRQFVDLGVFQPTNDTAANVCGSAEVQAMGGVIETVDDPGVIET
jgi:hypothetical protein